MKNIKNVSAAITLIAVMAFGTTFANAGIIIGGVTSENPCEQTVKPGIIIGGLTGIIIGGLTGIIIGGATDDTPVDCGIIIGG